MASIESGLLTIIRLLSGLAAIALALLYFPLLAVIAAALLGGGILLLLVLACLYVLVQNLKSRWRRPELR